MISIKQSHLFCVLGIIKNAQVFLFSHFFIKTSLKIFSLKSASQVKSFNTSKIDKNG